MVNIGEIDKNLEVTGTVQGVDLNFYNTYRSESPIIYYGSSITQGGCASRLGNAYTNIITRNLRP